jgi:hypothetical protein
MIRVLEAVLKLSWIFSTEGQCAKGRHRDAPSSMTAREAAGIRCRAGICDDNFALCFEKVSKHQYVGQL